MGKVDDMRAMREARWAAVRNQRPSQPKVERAADIDNDKGAPYRKGVKGQHVPLDTESCGHRSMSGGYCTRPKDHPEKNHRYKPLSG